MIFTIDIPGDQSYSLFSEKLTKLVEKLKTPDQSIIYLRHTPFTQKRVTINFILGYLKPQDCKNAGDLLYLPKVDTDKDYICFLDGGSLEVKLVSETHYPALTTTQAKFLHFQRLPITLIYQEEVNNIWQRIYS